MTDTLQELRRAWIYADSLRRQYPKAQGAKERIEISNAMSLLLAGSDRRHPIGFKLSKTEFDLNDTSRWPTCDAAFTPRKRFRLPSFDAGDTQLIMKAIDALFARCDKLDKVFGGTTLTGVCQWRRQIVPNSGVKVYRSG